MAGEGLTLSIPLSIFVRPPKQKIMVYPAQNSKSEFARFFLRTLPNGTKFIGQEGIYYKVVCSGTSIVRCRDFIFNLVWDLDGGAIVRVRRP